MKPDAISSALEFFITCFIPESSSKGRGGFATSARSDCAPNIQGAKDK